MKIEVGKKYKTKDGSTVKILYRLEHPIVDFYEMIGYMTYEVEGFISQWPYATTVDGKNPSDDYSIVEEII